MVRFVLVVVLSLQIFVCPIICRSGSCLRCHVGNGSEKSSSEAKDCCPKCRAATLKSDVSSPSRYGDHTANDRVPIPMKDGCRCQCICGGALQVQPFDARDWESTQILWQAILEMPHGVTTTYFVGSPEGANGGDIIFEAYGSAQRSWLQSWQC